MSFLKLIHGCSTFFLFVAHMSSKHFCTHTTLTETMLLLGYGPSEWDPWSVCFMCAKKDSQESYIHNRKMNRGPSIYLTYWSISQIITHFASEFCSNYFSKSDSCRFECTNSFFPSRAEFLAWAKSSTRCRYATLVAARKVPSLQLSHKIGIANADLI